VLTSYRICWGLMDRVPKEKESGEATGKDERDPKKKPCQNKKKAKGLKSARMDTSKAENKTTFQESEKQC